jgi:DnaD/phage-associated family protein
MSEQQADYITEALELIGLSEPKQIIQEVSGFVPVFEALLEKYDDHITALVFGRRWQYCRMKDGMCNASLERIAKDLKISAATVMRHTEKLVEDGYLIDLTPDLRNTPHSYADAGLVVMKSQLSATVSQRNVSISQRNATVSQSQLIKDSIRQDKTTTANIFQVYEAEIGILTPMIADGLTQAEKDYPFEWITEAIKEAAQNNKRNWKYVSAILKRWKEQGHKNDTRKSDNKIVTPIEIDREGIIKSW